MPEWKISKTGAMVEKPGVLARPPQNWTGETPVAPPQDSFSGHSPRSVLPTEEFDERAIEVLGRFLVWQMADACERDQTRMAKIAAQRLSGSKIDSAVFGPPN